MNQGVCLTTQIASQFTRAATSYDSLAIVQKVIADDLLEVLTKRRFERLLDVGCGTGRVTQQLSERAEQVIGLDLSMGMLRFAQTQPPMSPLSNITWLNADADQLPLASDSIDGVFSSMALQWSQNLSACYQELFRVCRPNARVVLAIMSHGSLFELADAWQILDQQQHINAFHDQQTLLSKALNAGFSGHATVKTYTTWHPNVTGAMHSIKDIGAKKAVATDNVVSLTKGRLIRLQQRYAELYEQAGQIPLTYKVTFLELDK